MPAPDSQITHVQHQPSRPRLWLVAPARKPESSSHSDACTESDAGRRPVSDRRD